MARIKRAVNGHKKRRKVFKLAKGYYGARHRQYRTAKQAVMKSNWYAYRGRKQKKRDYRSLWITRINAAACKTGRSRQEQTGLIKRGFAPLFLIEQGAFLPRSGAKGPKWP